MKVGNRISIDWCTFGSRWDDVEEYTVEEFRHTLGIFTSDERRESGEFTPLCELYTKGPESEKKYIPNHGEYTTNLVQGWSDLC